MDKIFIKIAKMIEKKETNQKTVAENLATSQANLSVILQGKTKPSNSLIKLANIIYGNEYIPQADPIIESVTRMMKDMDKATKKSVFDSIQKEKLLQDLMKEKESKRAA